MGVCNFFDITKPHELNPSELACGYVGDWCASEYLHSLIQHIRYVQEACRSLNVPEEQLRVHDQSKFSPQEFPYYAKHHKGGGDPKGFTYAWMHHLHNNPHHWQHWIFPDGYSPLDSGIEAGGVAQMPNEFVVEMVGDWIGASRSYSGTTDITDWLWKNMPRIRLHTRTAKHLRSILCDIGYSNVVLGQKFAHEIPRPSQGT